LPALDNPNWVAAVVTFTVDKTEGDKFDIKGTRSKALFTANPTVGKQYVLSAVNLHVVTELLDKSGD
jgi:hypothetical protein